MNDRQFRLNEEQRNEKLRSIRKIAAGRHVPVIEALVTWYEGGRKTEFPATQGIGRKGIEALIHDLEWIYQAPLAEGWSSSGYPSAYVKVRRTAQRVAASRGNGPKVLSDLLII